MMCPIALYHQKIMKLLMTSFLENIEIRLFDTQSPQSDD